MSTLTLLTTGLIAFYSNTATAPASSVQFAPDTSQTAGYIEAATPDPTAGQAAIDTCLKAPDRNCALAAALIVTADEELPIVRVDMLIAIAETFAAIGDQARAGETVDLARQAAEDIGISIGTEQKLARITGVLTTIGRKDEAFDIAAALNDRYLRADALGAIARAQAKTGDLQAAQTTLDRIEEPLLALRFAVDITENLAENSDRLDDIPVSAIEGRLAGLDHKLLKALGESRLATIEARRGNLDRATILETAAYETLPGINVTHERARLYAALAKTRLARGDRETYADYANRAANLAASVRSDYDRAIAIADAVSALGAGGNIDRALELAKRVKDLRAQSSLIVDLARKKSAAGIVAPYASHILEAADADDSRFERDRARLAVAEALTEIQETGQAAGVISRIEHIGAKARALATLARSLD